MRGERNVGRPSHPAVSRPRLAGHVSPFDNPSTGLRTRLRAGCFAFHVPPFRWTAWAQAIANRYAHRPAWQAPLATALVQRWQPVTLRPSVSHQLAFTIAPRIALTVFAPAGPATVQAGAMPMRPIPRILRQAPNERLTRRLETRERVEMTRTERLVRRLVARGERSEAARPGTRPVERPASTVEPASVPPPLPPVPRIVRHPTIEATAGPSTPLRAGRRLRTADDAAVGGRRSAVGTAVASEASQAVPAPIDLNRLTDQVIQAIDRRIIAHRERLGRI